MEDFLFRGPDLALFIPGIDLQGNEDPDNHKDDFPSRIQQVLAESVVGKEPLAYSAEGMEHWAGLVAVSKYEKVTNRTARLVKFHG
jgi:hypothetical protein